MTAAKSVGGREALALLEAGVLSPVETLRRLGGQDTLPVSQRAQPEAAAGSRSGPAEPPPTKSLTEVMGELDRLIGLGEVKALLKEIYAFTRLQIVRRSYGLKAEPQALHMVFRGNPGTGKTTVARLLAKSLRDLGVLSRGHLIEVERADLVGEYIGHTAQRTRDQLKRSQGGILFIDEAYSLARGGERDFGKEAIDTLVRTMEEWREDFILILAGYRDEMERFLRSNPGLRSRFPLHMDFPDYGAQELLAIAQTMLCDREYTLSPKALASLQDYLQGGAASSVNARSVRNLIERAIRFQAVRLLETSETPGRDVIQVIESEDLLRTFRAIAPESAKARLTRTG